MPNLAVDEIPIRTGRSRGFYVIIATAIVSIILLSSIFVYIFIDTHTQSYFGPGPIEIKVTPDKPFFLQGEQVNFTIVVINNQSWPISRPLSEEASIIKDGVPAKGGYVTMNINYGSKMPTYPANSTANIHWTWYEIEKDNQTIPHEIGNYSLTFTLRGVGYYATSNCTFEVNSQRKVR